MNSYKPFVTLALIRGQVWKWMLHGDMPHHAMACIAHPLLAPSSCTERVRSRQSHSPTECKYWHMSTSRRIRPARHFPDLRERRRIRGTLQPLIPHGATREIAVWCIHATYSYMLMITGSSINDPMGWWNLYLVIWRYPSRVFCRRWSTFLQCKPSSHLWCQGTLAVSRCRCGTMAMRWTLPWSPVWMVSFCRWRSLVVRLFVTTLMAAAPIVVPQLHIDPVVLPDPQYLQVTAYVPGGDTLISSRSASVADRRDRVFAVLQTILRQRFPDMAHVGFNVVKVHPSCSMLDPLPRSQKEKVVTVYTDDVLRLNAVVLLHLKFPPYDEEGAIYTLRRLRLHTLIGQLGLEALCGQNGDSCLCYINGIELTNDIEAAVEDAAFILCWLLPLAVADEVEVVSIADSTSVHSLVTTGPAPGPFSAASCQSAVGLATGSNMW